MTETRRESLSALIDGEASEIEVHRLVREFRDDESLTESWAVYQQIRATVRARSDNAGHLDASQHEALLGRISDAVHAEDTFTESAGKNTHNKMGSSMKVLGGSLALAASLVVAVFVGVQTQTGGDAEQTLAGETPATSVAQLASTPAVQVTPVSTAAPQELMELDEEKQRRLRAYLNQHERMSRSPNTQLVNFKDTSGSN